MANTANASLSTDFNVTPYYDDFDENKGFYRVLFKPGYAVQARELTQLQSILQKQIDRFGKHVFEEGSIVIPGSFQLYSANTQASVGPVKYVKVKDNDVSNNVVTITNFEDVEVIGQTSGVKGFVNFHIDGSEASGNTKTIYVDYLSASNANSAVKTFIPGETLLSEVGNLVIVNDTAALGTGSAFRISSGVIFSKGHFVSFPTQEVILDRYNDMPTCKVGFKVIETIVTSEDDSSLLDPALEASNYSAPGADRLQLTAELQVRNIDDTESLPDFVTLFTIKDGVIQTIADRTQYSILKDEFAKRTFDESGDYYVSGLNIDIREHLNTGNNGGLLSAAQGGNSEFISVKVEAGTAYVKGYEVGTLVPTYLSTPRSTAFTNVNNQIVSAFMGSYITVGDMVGTLPLDTGTVISLYDKYQDRVSNSTYVAAQTGNLIGNARVVSVEYNSGTLGALDGKADLYLTDIRMLGSNSFASVNSVFIQGSSYQSFGADVIPNAVTGQTTLSEAFTSPLLYYTGSNYTRKIRDTSGNPDTTYNYMTTLPVTVLAAGTFTVSAPGSDSLPYTGTLSTTNKREIFLVSGTSANITLAGTVSKVGTNTIVGSGTSFTKLNVGDKVQFSGNANTYTVTSIANTTYMNLAESSVPTLSGNTAFKAIKAGSLIDLTTLGYTTGATRSVTAAGSTLTFDLHETYPTDLTGSSISFKVARSTAKEAAKVLKSSRYVQINCAAAGVTGPYNLGFADVFRIKQIRKNSALFTANTEGTDVTSSFIFNNGQKDTYYDHATITPRSSLTSADCLLVELDYFAPDFSQGKGYFSVDSYPVDDANSSTTTISTAEIPIFKSPTSGQTYDLRNHIDFRPVKTATSSDSTTVAGASVNPTLSTTFTYTGSGLSLVAPSSEITFDYSYYLARKDVVSVNKDKIFSITQGQPAVVPITPEVSDNEMALAVLTISPYPSISPYYGKILGRQDIASSARRVAAVRQTMRDLGVMKERISNLEYYAALSLLEKNALDMLILDSAGNDRFKNGIFVDTFTNHVLGATYNEDYRIVVDPTEKSIRPLYSMQSIDYDYLSGTNVRKTGDLVTLDYTEVEFANVASATSIMTTEKASYRFIGDMVLIPADDVWVDTITLPPNIVSANNINIDGLGDAQQVGGTTMTWNAWQTKVVGYKVYKGTGDKKTFVGEFATETEANKIAQGLRTTKNGATIETLYETSRTGTEYFTFVDKDQASFGERVVETHAIPYIRPQVLMGYVNGLKPFARFTAFFDTINMTDYVRPVTEAEFDDTASVKTWTYNNGDPLYANADGQLWFRLTLPPTDNLRFTVGSKRVLITDSLNGTDEATSWADRYFFAQGTSVTKQETILSTRQVEKRQKSVVETTNSSTFKTLPPIQPPPPPPPKDNKPPGPTDHGGGGMPGGNGGVCMAYVLPIKADDDGLFLTSVDVFCAEKHPTLGVWFEVRELDSGGNITLNSVPFSKVWLTNAEVPISTNGIDNPLKITFEAPLFLYADKSYAFVIHPEAGNPNYYFWFSKIGENDVNTGQQITSRIWFGTVFVTNNDTIWVPLTDMDLTCKWYRASFSPTSGQFTIGNHPKEKLYLNNIVGSLEGAGEPFPTSDKLTLNVASAAVQNDFIVGATSGVNARVLYVSAGKYVMDNIRFTTGETVTVRYGANAAVKLTANITAIENGTGHLEYYKESPNSTFMIITDSNGNYSANDMIFDISDEGYGTITSISNQRYSTIDFEPAVINFPSTATVYDLISYANGSTTYTSTRIDANENYSFDSEKAVYSRSNEIANVSGNRTSRIDVTLSTSSNYLSPVFDLGRTHSIIVDNLINNDTTGENGTSGGNLFNKYISKIVTLADGQDAEDIKVYLTAYRPPNTDVKVWVKILNGEDSDTMAQKSWIELEKTFGGDITYSSIANKNDFKEYQYGFPSSYLTGTIPGTTTTGIVRYTNSQGIGFNGYKSFQIKVGLMAAANTTINSAVVPRVADLRTIALQI